MTDDEQLVALFEQMCQAWTSGDAQVYGECFSRSGSRSCTRTLD
jgi:hypothetical protein